MSQEIKQTRTIAISEKVFTANDLRRIAKIFEKQKLLPAISEWQPQDRISYKVTFSDNTSSETTSAELFEDDSLTAPGRPIIVNMSFRDLRHRLSLSLRHGSAGYSNQAEISSYDPSWLGETFMSLKAAIDSVAPQKCFFRKYKSLLDILIALNSGALLVWIFNLTVRLLDLPTSAIGPLLESKDTWYIYPTLAANSSVTVWLCSWLTRAAVGSSMVFAANAYIADTWPSVEFNFGSDHLKSERNRREVWWLIVSLIIVPIVITIIFG